MPIVPSAGSAAQVTSGSAADAGLVLSGVTKAFAATVALNNVSFDCRPGEIHALAGENGSGKSTLIKVAAGVVVPDAGTVQIGGETLRSGVPRHSRRHGLITAYQDTSLIDDLTVGENIQLSFHSLGKAAPDINSLLSRYNLSFGPGDTVKSLGPGGRQMLEVVRAIAHAPSILLLDEPTAALDMPAAHRLHELIRRSRDEGLGVVYVSHRLGEIRNLADRLTVIRDGVIRGTYDQMGWEVREIVELMVGASVDLEFPSRPIVERSGTPLLAVHDLEGPGVGPVSISVHSGEIVGIAGAEGNGQRQLLRAIVGIDRKGGSVSIGDEQMSSATPVGALKAGIMLQSGNRAQDSMFMSMSALDNTVFQIDQSAGPANVAPRRRLLRDFRSAEEQFRIVAASPYQPASGLSGGNQQKIVLSRLSVRPPRVLIVDEPTQGVDAVARLDIYGALSSAAADGIGVLVNSSDSAELAGLCDRVYVLSRGVVIDEITGEFDESAIVERFVGTDSRLNRHVASRPGLRQLSELGRSPLVPVAVLVVLIFALGLYTNSKAGSFLTGTSINNILLTATPLLFAALGQQFALLAGEFDISIGANMTLSVVACSFLLSSSSRGSLILGTLLILGIGVCTGLFNSFLTRVLNVNPIVATIGTLFILSGIAVQLRPQPGGEIDISVVEALHKSVGGVVPYGVVAAAVIAVLLDVWLTRTGMGLALRAVGLGSDSSGRVGIGVNRMKAACYVLAAVGATAGGVFLAAQVGLGSNDVALTLALPVFAACFLGGATLTGGRGSFVGAGLGVILLTMIGSSAQVLGASYDVSQVIYGAILLVAVAAYAFAERSAGRSEGTR
jgi:ribose transport system ATP-binding protein